MICFNYNQQHVGETVSRLAWEYLGVPPEELEEVAGDRDVWVAAPATRPPEKR